MPFTTIIKLTGEIFEAVTQYDENRQNSHNAELEVIRDKFYDGYRYVDAQEVSGLPGVRTFIYTKRDWETLQADELETDLILPECQFKQVSVIPAAR